MLSDWSAKRLKRACRDLLRQTELNLSGFSIYTEAATGHYSVGAGMALLAGAKSVHCVARTSRFGSASEATDATRDCAAWLGIDTARLSFSEGHSADALAAADIVTNMGMVRPIDSWAIARMRPGTVISLMYEPWEFRSQDIDLAAARQQGVWVVGVSENHKEAGCYRASAALAIKGVLASGLGMFSNDLLLVCDNPFAPYVAKGIAANCHTLDILDRGTAGFALPDNVRRIDPSHGNCREYDALILHDVPQPDRWTLAADGDAVWNRSCLGTFDVCVQVMGDVRREDFPDVHFFPRNAPERGYMGMNPAELGPDLVLRLIVSGLCAGAEMRTYLRCSPGTPVDWRAMRWSLPLTLECGI